MRRASPCCREERGAAGVAAGRAASGCSRRGQRERVVGGPRQPEPWSNGSIAGNRQPADPSRDADSTRSPSSAPMRWSERGSRPSGNPTDPGQGRSVRELAAGTSSDPASRSGPKTTCVSRRRLAQPPLSMPESALDHAWLRAVAQRSRAASRHAPLRRHQAWGSGTTTRRCAGWPSSDLSIPIT